MTYRVNEKAVMDFFLEEMNADRIEYLKNRDSAKSELRETIERMLDAKTMNEKIQIAIVLWKQLFTAAMSHIDKNKAGYDKLFKYFDEYVEFEELIFASDSFYRDHTLHCLWVYFLGEYISRHDRFSKLLERERREEWLVRSMVNIFDDPIFQSDPKFSSVCRRTKNYLDRYQYRDACFCIEALTHDLGYPLKKIEKISKAIKKVLPYYSIKNFEDFSFGYDGVQNNFVARFLELISRNVEINFQFSSTTIIEPELVKLLAKFSEFEYDGEGNICGSLGIQPENVQELTQEDKLSFKDRVVPGISFCSDYSVFQSMQNDFESYQHGIMSAFLLAKNLEAFQNMHYAYDRHDPEGTISNFGSFCNKLDILRGITNHTRESFQIRRIDSTETLLTFVDELEEFSRISRASQNREYVEEFCTTDLYMEDGTFCIDFIFDNNELESLDPEIAFKGRCKRLIKLFDIENLQANLKFRLRCIGKLEKNQHQYELQIGFHHAVILIDGVSQNIPKYLKSNQFYTSEEYARM